MNAVERDPVETRFLNPTASEASYKPKQRSYRTTNLKKKSYGAEMYGAELSSAETYPTLVSVMTLCRYYNANRRKFLQTIFRKGCQISASWEVSYGPPPNPT